MSAILYKNIRQSSISLSRRASRKLCFVLLCFARVCILNVINSETEGKKYMAVESIMKHIPQTFVVKVLIKKMRLEHPKSA